MIYDVNDDVNDDEDDDDDNATMHLPCTCHALCMYTGSMAPIAHDTRLRNRFRTDFKPGKYFKQISNIFKPGKDFNRISAVCSHLYCTRDSLMGGHIGRCI